MKPSLFASLIMLLAFSAVAADEVDSGIAAFKAKKYRAALAQLTPVAQAGDARAQLYLGRLCANGRAGEMDDVEAANWFEKAAEQDNAEAQYLLARLYLAGYGVDKNAQAANDWLWKSGRLGYVKAQLLLGKLLSEGTELPQNVDAARLWYAQAASSGNRGARQQLDRLGGVDALPDQGRGLGVPESHTATAASLSKDELSPQQRVQRRLAELKAVHPSEESQQPASALVSSEEQSIIVAAPTASVDDGLMILPVDDTDGADDTVGSDADADELVLEEFETGSDESSSGDTLVLNDDVLLVDDEVGGESGLSGESEAEPVVAGADMPDPESTATTAGEAMGQVAATATAPASADDSMASDTEDALHDRAWLMSRPPSHYTIQLLGSWTRADAEDFVAANPLPGVGALVESRRRGKPWFVLYYGDFGSYADALAAHSKLSGGIARHGPWLRSYKKVQASMGK